jgi:hypothetical protein
MVDVYRKPLVLDLTTGLEERIQSGDGLDLGAWQAPIAIGDPGQVLAAPATGTIAEWVDPDTGPAGPGYLATSATDNVAIGTGSKTLVTQTGLAYTAGARVRATDGGNVANYMEGVVTSYSTTSLVFTSDLVGGSGTPATWNINLAGNKGTAGADGSDGSNGSNGSNGAVGAGYTATSTTSLLIEVASKQFTTQAGLAYTVGARARASSAAGPTNYVEGLVSGYSSTTLTINVDRIGGTGTKADWNINLVGDVGATGSTGASGVDDIILTNANAGTIAICFAVYVKSNGNVDLAKADAVGTTETLGLVEDAAGITTVTPGKILMDGILTATDNQWKAVQDVSASLVPGKVYFLSAATAGKIAVAAPSTGFVQRVGRAISTTQMDLQIMAPIKL